MDLYVYNPQGRKIDVVEGYSSLQWTRRYYESGSFELHCDPVYADLLLMNHTLWPSGDLEAGTITSRSFQLDEGGKETLIVSGKLKTGLLSRRILWREVSFSGTYERLMRQLVDANAVTTDADRAIPGLSIAPPAGYTEALEEYSESNTKLDEALAKLSRACELGHRIRFDPATGLLRFEVYAGLDRTMGQRVNNPALFSVDFENLTSAQYHEGDEGSANVALVIGEDDQRQPVRRTVGSAAGLERREVCIDAKRVKKKLEDGTVLSNARFNAAIDQYGVEQLGKMMPIRSIDARIKADGNLAYGEDYDLGDIVTIVLDNWGVRTDARLTDVQVVYEGAGRSVYAVFGDDPTANRITEG